VRPPAAYSPSSPAYPETGSDLGKSVLETRVFQGNDEESRIPAGGSGFLSHPPLTCPPLKWPLSARESLVVQTKGGQEMPRGKTFAADGSGEECAAMEGACRRRRATACDADRLAGPRVWAERLPPHFSPSAGRRLVERGSDAPSTTAETTHPVSSVRTK
jgi:hypothetical protein